MRWACVGWGEWYTSIAPMWIFHTMNHTKNIIKWVLYYLFYLFIVLIISVKTEKIMGGLQMGGLTIITEVRSLDTRVGKIMIFSQKDLKKKKKIMHDFFFSHKSLFVTNDYLFQFHAAIFSILILANVKWNDCSIYISHNDLYSYKQNIGHIVSLGSIPDMW